ncbi:glycosyltransferase family 4 protein [Vibrio diabolicus]|uniref:glycosyltransferase family 4 protein n=1 Tax=Vibrio diabolicus TaxID=50719 RepID=UPI00293FEA69|nr:glycosyltransferase family 4 protein [Vibrio diabolicus]MDV5037639.1 glycosyltransferase family 4 protein [Vibrio diabolicus]
MKVLIVNASDINGGAARAAYRLHQSLIASNIDSNMLVQKKFSDDFTVLGPETKLEKSVNVCKYTIDIFPTRFYKNKKSTPFSPAWLPSKKLIRQINSLNPDIVHLHWTNAGMIKIEDLESINAPIIWSLHDMWAFTGGCHYDENCAAFKNSCGSCPVLNSGTEVDLSRRIFNRKKKIYSKINNLTIVGLSKWLENCVRESSLLRDKRIINLPNPIDINLYKPFEKTVARDLWNLPKDKKLVLFGAMGATSDPRKGFKELKSALRKITITDVEFVIFGASKPANSADLGVKAHFVGSLNDDISLVSLYSAVDVMVVPSLQENLSNAIMESLSCGTPVVAFDIGGNSDLVEHKNNGYLAQSFDTKDLANGIEWVLHNEEYQDVCASARQKVIEEFSSNIVSQKYIELYRSIIANPISCK